MRAILHSLERHNCLAYPHALRQATIFRDGGDAYMMTDIGHHKQRHSFWSFVLKRLQARLDGPRLRCVTLPIYGPCLSRCAQVNACVKIGASPRSLRRCSKLFLSDL